MKETRAPMLTVMMRFLKEYRLVLILLILLGLAIDLLLNYSLNQKFLGQQQVRVNAELSAVRARLEEKLNSNLFLLYGMAGYISTHPVLAHSDFNSVATELIKQSTSLKNIAAAPDFTIRYVYPLEGNEAILGVNYRDIPAQWQRALDAKKTGKMAIAGPLNLIQGGQGLIARIPVFQHTTGEFWGLLSSVMDLDELLEQVELENISNSLRISIRGKDSKGAQGEVFWGDAALFKQSAEATLMPVSLPSGSWMLAAIPKQGWQYTSPYASWIHGATFICGLIVLMTSLQMSRAKQHVIENEARLKAMSDASLDALIMTDSKDIVRFWNPAAETLFGYGKEEALGQRLHELILHPDELDKVRSGMREFARSGQGKVVNTTMEMQALNKSGQELMVERTVASFNMGGGWYAVGSVRDITARKDMEQQLQRLARTDELTNLANRRHFLEQAEILLKQAKRYHHPYSLMIFDIDFFKRINDNYGHDVGDLVLMELGKESVKTLRTSDVIGRLGGEEFIVAMPETDVEEAFAVAERLRRKLSQMRISTPHGLISFSVSIGLAQMESVDTSLSQLVKKADEAMYVAKGTGRNKVVESAL